jgi:hypothetical protein
MHAQMSKTVLHILTEMHRLATKMPDVFLVPFCSSGQVGRPPCLVGTIEYMGRPRGKSKKAIEAASNDDEDGSSGEEVPPTPKRRGRRPQKPLNDDADDKDTAEAEEDAGDGAKPVVQPSKDSKSSAEGGGKKRRRRRLKRGPDELVEEEGEEGRVKSKSNGFRPNGSRRKSTPRRAAEAGVECK